MDILSKTKTKIEELNQRFFFILENFVTDYVSYLKDPSNPTAADEIQHVRTVVNKIDSDGFILKNSMDSAIEESQQEVRQQNIEISNLKIENENLKEEAKHLKRTALTSEGLFDEELEWYKLQLKLLIIMIIGFILCGMLYYDLQLTNTEHIVIIGGAIFLGSIEYTYNIIHNMIKKYKSKHAATDKPQ
jgi:hypothetical protein